MADLLSLSEGAQTFFCESTSFYLIFSILRLQLRILDYAMGRAFFITLEAIEKIACLVGEKKLIGRVGEI